MLNPIMGFYYNTEFLMHDGSTKLIQDIEIGDLLMGCNFLPIKVTNISKHYSDLYSVTNKYNESYIVSQNHSLTFKEKFTNFVFDISLNEYLNLSEYEKNNLYNFFTSVDFPTKNIDIDPYDFGQIMNTEKYTYILPEYKCNSWNIRLKFLSGIVNENINPFLNKTFVIKIDKETSKDWINDIIYIIKSLGFNMLKETHSFSTNTCRPEKNQITFSTNFFEHMFYINIEKIGYGDTYSLEVEELTSRVILSNFIVCNIR